MLAAIDVGSNTVRMLTGEVCNGLVIPHRYERVITRLKGGQTANGLSAEAMDRTFSAIEFMVEASSSFNISKIRVVGTEALRSALNGHDFALRTAEKLNLDFRIVSGDEEAALSAGGVLAALDPLPEKALVIDIGGGSTEFILVSGCKILFRTSTPLGVVHLAEMASQLHRPFIRTELLEVEKGLFRAGLLEEARSSSCCLVGTAGTITTLAAIDLKMAVYDWKLVNNHLLPSDSLAHIYKMLTPLNIKEREAVTGLEEGRGDLIIPGLDILLEIMNLFTKNEVVVSDFGLLEGVLLQMANDTAID